MLDAIFRQQSNGAYKAVARVKNLVLDDLRASNKPESVTRMVNRHFTLDPDVQMLVASFDFTPKTESTAALRKCKSKKIDCIDRLFLFFR